MTINVYGYCNTDNNDAPDFTIHTVNGEDDLEYVAQEAAADYHRHYDGWEASWPVTFTLFNERGDKLGDYEVERETVPEFRTIRKVKPCNSSSTTA